MKSGFSILIAVAFCFFDLISDATTSWATDIEQFFNPGESLNCPVREWNVERKPRSCQHSNCGRIKREEKQYRVDTGYDRGWCSFQPKNFDVQICRHKGHTDTERAEVLNSSDRYVDFLKRQCNIFIRCYVPIYEINTCANVAGCGEDIINTTPKSYQNCRSFFHGIDNNKLRKVWNDSNENMRGLLRVILLIDKNKSGLPQDVTKRIIGFLRAANPDDATHQVLLIKLGDLLETKGSSAVEQDVILLVGS
jgi:hypothetical protein